MSTKKVKDPQCHSIKPLTVTMRKWQRGWSTRRTSSLTCSITINKILWVQVASIANRLQGLLKALQVWAVRVNFNSTPILAEEEGLWTVLLVTAECLESDRQYQTEVYQQMIYQWTDSTWEDQGLVPLATLILIQGGSNPCHLFNSKKEKSILLVEAHNWISNQLITFSFENWKRICPYRSYERPYCFSCKILINELNWMSNYIIDLFVCSQFNSN